jgi:hypothetical protein
MMRLTLGMAAALCLSTSLSFAQPDTTKLHEAKMKMIREAVNFYSSDAKQPGHGVKCNSLVLAELKECAKPLSKVDAKIDKWNGMSVATEALLNDLGTTILSDVTQGKDYRKQLQGYSQFEQDIKELGDTKVDVTVPAQTAGTAAVIPDVKSDPAPQSTQVQSQPAVVETSSGGGLIWKDPAILSWTAVAIALIALLVALLSGSKKSNRRSGSSREMQPPVFQDYSSPGSKLELIALEEKIARLSSELDSANEIIREMDRRLTAKVQQLETREPDYAPRQEQIASATQFSASKKWAKNVDGGGFEMDALSSEPDSKMIYEITQTGSRTAMFKVSETREAQLFALTNPQNYLREGCNYTSQPSSNSQIRTEVPGTLELQGRKWRIINPAQIAFS